MSISDRILADSTNRPLWKSMREGKIGASDAGKYAKFESVDLYVRAKLEPSFDGNQYTDHGNDREAIILQDHGYQQNTFMFTHESVLRHVATPDAIGVQLAQVKCTIKDFQSKRTGEILIPAHYRRQMWWEQYVMGEQYTRTDFIYEKYQIINGVLVPEFESTVVPVDRDEAEISKMVKIANEVLRRIDLSSF